MTHVASQISTFESDSSRTHGRHSPQDATRQRPLAGVTVCHLTPLERLRDERAFTRESLPTQAYGLRAVIVGPHAQSGLVEEVEFIPIAKSRNRAHRLLTAARIITTALKQRADIYHVHNPELIIAGIVLKLVFRKKVIYDTREDFPSMMLTKTYLPRSLRKPMSKIVSRFEKFAARMLDGVITADAGSLRPLARTGNSKKLVFYNFPNLRYFPEKAGMASEVSRSQPCSGFGSLGAPTSTAKAYDLVYRGGLSERAGTFELLKAVHLLRQRNISARLLLFGYTDDRKSGAAITNSIRNLGIEDLVTLGGLIPHEKMAETLSLARIAVCPLQKTPKFLNNIPVKVFESWACGLPVIATDLPPIRPFFGRRRLGLLVKPGDPQELADAIVFLMSSPNLAQEFGCRARQVVAERYNTSVEVRKLISFYTRVLTC